MKRPYTTAVWPIYPENMSVKVARLEAENKRLREFIERGGNEKIAAALKEVRDQ